MKISVTEYKTNPIYPRIANAVSECISESNQIESINVFVKIGYLIVENLKRWKNGDIDFLERVLNCNLSKAGTALRILRYHAHDLNLIPKLTKYEKNGKILRFSKYGDANIEKAYMTVLLKNAKPSKNKDQH